MRSRVHGGGRVHGRAVRQFVRSLRRTLLGVRLLFRQLCLHGSLPATFLRGGSGRGEGGERWGGGAYVLEIRGELGPFRLCVCRFRGGSVVPGGLVNILHILMMMIAGGKDLLLGAYPSSVLDWKHVRVSGHPGRDACFDDHSLFWQLASKRNPQCVEPVEKSKRALWAVSLS